MTYCHAIPIRLCFRARAHQREGKAKEVKRIPVDQTVFDKEAIRVRDAANVHRWISKRQ
jgi:hypothetical protein